MSLKSWAAGEEGFAESLRLRRVERVPVGTQSSHTLGILMSQRGCPALNRPILAVSAVEPVDTGIASAIALRNWPLTWL